MKSNATFTMGNISERFHNIIDELKVVLKSNTEILDVFNAKLSEVEKNKILTVSFIGQYNAGKSTIIKALTGNESIIVHSNVATDKTTDYTWNNIILTDTPGLWAKKIEDHDNITYSKIKESDLLVYCITSDLFDDIILNNFKKLAFTEDYGNKMMLVVNKMASEGKSGEYDELVKNYSISLNNAISPKSIEMFSPVFIDMSDYNEGKNENEQDLIELSHFSDFIDGLNRFVTKKGIMGKLDTPFRITISLIDEVLLENENTEDKELFQTIRRIENTIIQNKENTESKIKLMITELAIKIVKCSNEVTNAMGREDINIEEKSNKLNAEIEKLISETRDEILSTVEASTEKIRNEIQGVVDSDIAGYVFESINSGKIKLEKTTFTDFSNIINHFGNVEKIGKNGADYLVKNYISEGAKGVGGFAKSANVAGSNLHNTVKTFGHLFGKTFKPWEAVNIAKNIGNVAQSVGPILATLGVVLEIGQAVSDENNAKKLADAKNTYYSAFVNISNDVENEFIKNLDNIKKNVYVSVLEEISKLKNKIQSERDFKSELSKTLLEKKKQLQLLLNEIYQ